MERRAQRVRDALALFGTLRSRAHDNKTLLEVLRRPEMDVAQLEVLAPELTALALTDDERAALEGEVKYAGYVVREREQVERMRRHEHVEIPRDFDYGPLRGLANEAKAKLTELRPLTLGQAARLAGVRPPDVALLAVHVERWRRERSSAG
jgi:tRNA uridine 5-carboxymethylaminomethyl modification enzyme